MYAVISDHFYMNFRAFLFGGYTQKYLATLTEQIWLLQVFIPRFGGQMGQDLCDLNLFYCRSHHYKYRLRPSLTADLLMISEV